MTSKVLKRSLYFIRISHKCQKFLKIESIWPFCWTIGPFIFSNDELLISLLNRDRLNGSKFISSDDSLLLSDITDILELIEFKTLGIFSPLFASFSPLNVSRISSKSISFQDFSTHPVKIDRLMRLINASRVGNISRNQNQPENTRKYKKIILWLLIKSVPKSVFSNFCKNEALGTAERSQLIWSKSMKHNSLKYTVVYTVQRRYSHKLFFCSSFSFIFVKINHF